MIPEHRGPSPPSLKRPGCLLTAPWKVTCALETKLAKTHGSVLTARPHPTRFSPGAPWLEPAVGLILGSRHAHGLP